MQVQYLRNNPNLPAHSQARSWVETTRAEMKRFLALSLLMGIVRKPAISDYWSTNPLLKGSVYNNVMPRNRYQTILRFLHFADKVRPLVDLLVSKFKIAYTQRRIFLLTRSCCYGREGLSSSSISLSNVLALVSRCLACAKLLDTCGIHMFTWEKNPTAEMQISNWSTDWGKWCCCSPIDGDTAW